MSNIDIYQLHSDRNNKYISEISPEELANICGGSEIDFGGAFKGGFNLVRNGFEAIGAYLAAEELISRSPDAETYYDFSIDPGYGTYPGTSTINQGIDVIDSSYSFGNSFG